MWQGKTLPLDHAGPNRWEKEKRERKERGKKEERKRRRSRERSSTLSLKFSTIGLLVSVGAKGKVLPLSKSFK